MGIDQVILISTAVFLVAAGFFTAWILQQSAMNRLEDRVIDAEAFLRKMQQEHHDLRRQFLQLEIDFIVLQEGRRNS